MLELKDICKSYRVGEVSTQALRGVSVAFRQREFVSILGASGSGKTTCLNIIGGLDRYDSGDLIIKGKHTKDFSQKDWDAYRNNSVGFVFQSYNLISHLSIVANVELGMTLSGISRKQRRSRAEELLKKVGLGEHLHKRPNQLSGGQMQRVAIARALANDPEILLCDEPTGALDTVTSRQVMELIKQAAGDRLVIMVTHNPELAREYSDRIIEFSDGSIVSDSHPYSEAEDTEKFELKRTRMSFLTALSLSANNLRTKKGRTFLTSLASSVGIIGIALILALSGGFKVKIQDFQSDVMAEFPVIISRAGMNSSAEEARRLQGTLPERFADTDRALIYDPAENTMVHQNVFSKEYLEYIGNIDPAICKSVGRTYLVNINLVGKRDGKYFASGLSAISASSGGASVSSGMSAMGISSYPVSLVKGEDYIKSNYDLLAGEYPAETTDIVLVLDSRNRLPRGAALKLGIDPDNTEAIPFTDIVGTEYRLADNNDYYNEAGGYYLPSSDLEGVYNAENSIKVRITGVIRQKESSSSALLSAGLAYSDALAQQVLKSSADSDIVRAQRASDKSVLTGQKLTKEEKEQLLMLLGGDDTPYMLMLYPADFEAKNKVLAYLDAYNTGRSDEDMVIYTDLAGTISGMTDSIINGILVVLIAFAALSLVVSVIMICIITYTSVLERTKEIGVLRALGARKKDITRVFVAETCLLGIFSGMLGIAAAYLLCLPVNAILENLTGLAGVAQLDPLQALGLAVLSTVMTMLGGFVPALIAANKDAVEALRSE